MAAADLAGQKTMVEDASFARSALGIELAWAAPAVFAGEGHPAQARAIAGRLNVEIHEHTLPFSTRAGMPARRTERAIELALRTGVL